MNKIFKQYSLNAIVFKLQLIYSTEKIASEMPVPHSLGKYFQHHEIQKYCISTNYRILSEHSHLYKGPNNV